jgi:hypothetical protein
MKRSHEDAPVSTLDRGAGTSGVSEPSFVDALVSPTNVFRHPQEVAHHPWFTDQEKRAVLLSWARDELMAEQLASKAGPELDLTSCIDALVEVLAHYDPLAAGEYCSALATIRERQAISLPGGGTTKPLPK